MVNISWTWLKVAPLSKKGCGIFGPLHHLHKSYSWAEPQIEDEHNEGTTIYWRECWSLCVLSDIIFHFFGKWQAVPLYTRRMFRSKDSRIRPGSRSHLSLIKDLIPHSLPTLWQYHVCTSVCSMPRIKLYHLDTSANKLSSVTLPFIDCIWIDALCYK